MWSRYWFMCFEQKWNCAHFVLVMCRKEGRKDRRKGGRKLEYMSCLLYQSIRNVLFYRRFWKCPLLHGQKLWTFSSCKELNNGRTLQEKKTGSHLDRSPSGMKRFMNHVDGVESGPYSTYNRRQTVIVCMCICVWRESLLCAGPCLCVFARSCAANTFTQPPRSLSFLNYGFCCNLTAKTWGIEIIMPQKPF